jgi:hypothetical protein
VEKAACPVYKPCAAIIAVVKYEIPTRDDKEHPKVVFPKGNVDITVLDTNCASDSGCDELESEYSQRIWNAASVGSDATHFL